MNFQDYTQMYCRYSANQITLQEYIDYICNHIKNNEVVEHLHKFQQAIQEVNNHFGLTNQSESSRFTVYADDGQVYYYFIRKIPLHGHYCLYVSIPGDHPLAGVSYEEINDATHTSIDSTDPSRTVFGWDYAHFNMSTPAMIHLLAFYHPENLLDKEIITLMRIITDAHKYIDYMAENAV
jgi:hypothetical protein